MKQITIIADDKVGLLADISYILGKSRINIEAIAVEVHGSKAIINLTAKDEKKAHEMLASNGYKVLESEILVVKVKDEPGALSEISRMMRDAGINIENLYLLSRADGHSLDAIKVDKPKAARKLLEKFIVNGE